MTMNDMSVFKVEGFNSFVYFTFICHESKKDYKFILKNSDLLELVSTYQDYETECTEDTEQNFWVCEIKNEDCQEGDIIGSLATAAVEFYSYQIQMEELIEHEIITQEEEAPKQNLKECDEIPVVADFYREEWGIYEELFRKIKDYDLRRTEADGETYETQFYNVQIHDEPIEADNAYLKHDNLVHITFYCTQSDVDAVFVLKNDPVKTEIASLSDHPTDCLYLPAEGKYHCDIIAKNCAEGEIIGALVFQNDEEITWTTAEMDHAYETELHPAKDEDEEHEEFDDLGIEGETDINEEQPNDFDIGDEEFDFDFE